LAFANPSISDIVATTIQNRSGKIADNVTDNNALLKVLSKRGNVKPFSGGNVILQELSFRDNGNTGYYSGYDLLPVAAQDVISAAEYAIKQAAAPVVISGLEELQNSGKEQIIDLLEGRIQVAEASLANLLANGIYSDGSGSGGKQITGLDAAVPVSPTNVYGGIDRNTWAFWQNAVDDDGSAPSSSTIQGIFNGLYARLCRGSDHPDLVIVDNPTWATYMASLQANQRFMDADTADLGFPTVKYMGSNVVLDGGIEGNCPANTAFFLNTKYIFWRPHSKRNMVPLSPQKRYAVNQDAEVQIIAFAGNLTTSGAKFQGRFDGNA
jgi:hypothetical protein